MHEDKGGERGAVRYRILVSKKWECECDVAVCGGGISKGFCEETARPVSMARPLSL